MSDVCELFGCTPREALRQNLNLVNRIADYRAAKLAVEAMNGGEAGAKRLVETPALGNMLAELMRAQQETLD